MHIQGANVCLRHTFAQDSRLIVEKRKFRLNFRTHQHTGMNIHIYILMHLTGQYTFAVHNYVCNVPKLCARQYRVSAFPYCFYLAPLTSSWPVRAISMRIVVAHLRHP